MNPARDGVTLSLTPAARSFFEGTPWRLIAVLAVGLLASATLFVWGWLPLAALRVATVTAAHGAMLATALGWAAAENKRRDDCPSPVVGLALIGIGAGAASVHVLGAFAYLLVPLWVRHHSARGRLVALGLGTPVPPLAIAAGILAGVLLGAHLLVSATLTRGYRPHVGNLATLAAAIAYDAGVQVLVTECLFRGALFNRAQRRWSFAVGATLSTVASVARYLLDPLLPGTVELMVGTVFYVTVLSLTSACLFWQFGTLTPAVISSLLFFVAYRLVLLR